MRALNQDTKIGIIAYITVGEGRAKDSSESGKGTVEKLASFPGFPC